MIYELPGGRSIDTARDLTFEERNFVQKMMIYAHLKMGLDDFRAKWRAPGNPVWQGQTTLDNPGPAALILLDLERKVRRGKD